MYTKHVTYGQGTEKHFLNYYNYHRNIRKQI